ncbi:chromatin remodeling regulator CECR2-like isoform X10 [Dipodomys merriami]|uniref:chromatin remodeling regulator CECR2-like isoform X11 n=1 Tax=Dipodomys merriami TaxID=94247 RepID=UPI0038502F2F
MCPEERGATGLGELRSWWEVPAIAHFCSLFCTACCLPDFEIEEPLPAFQQLNTGSHKTGSSLSDGCDSSCLVPSWSAEVSGASS